ncbi:MAG: iron-sulfur cluster assembly protein, partial [Rubrimonas sp.]
MDDLIAAARAALAGVTAEGRPLADSPRLSAITARDGRLSCAIAVDAAEAAAFEPVRAAAEAAL